MNTARLDRFGFQQQIEYFVDRKLITDVINIIKSGKEANVYCCQAHPSTGEEFLAAKVYRQSIHRSFKNDAVYQQGRVRDGRSQRAMKKKTQYGRDIQFSTWISNEFEALNDLYEAGVDVPKPFAMSEGAILIEYIGEEDFPAPLLNRVHFGPDEGRLVFGCLIRNIRQMLAENRVHADLSPFNILYWQGDVKIIDFPQSVHPRYNPDALQLLTRDIDRICRHFSQYGVKANPLKLAQKLWMGFLGRRSETVHFSG